MPLLLTLAIFAGFFAFAWVAACMVTGARYDAARDREWAAFGARNIINTADHQATRSEVSPW